MYPVITLTELIIAGEQFILTIDKLPALLHARTKQSTADVASYIRLAMLLRRTFAEGATKVFIRCTFHLHPSSFYDVRETRF